MSRNTVTLDLPSYSPHTRWATPRANAHCLNRLDAFLRDLNILTQSRRRIGVVDGVSIIDGGSVAAPDCSHTGQSSTPQAGLDERLDSDAEGLELPRTATASRQVAAGRVAKPKGAIRS